MGPAFLHNHSWMHCPNADSQLLTSLFSFVKKTQMCQPAHYQGSPRIRTILASIAAYESCR